jgi:hypothetical protein
MTTLMIECEGSAPARVELPPGEYSLGSDNSCAITIDHPTLSSHHCDVLIQVDGKTIVCAAGATNSTWIEGELVSRTVVVTGQSFQAGAAKITVEKTSTIALPPRLATP